MASITIQGTTTVSDTYMKLSTPTSNFDGVGVLYIGERNDQVGSSQRSLIKFDLSSIPSGSTINSATLSIYALLNLSSNTRTYRVFRVKQVAVGDQLTWNSYSTGNSWATAGCSNTTSDREAADIGSRSFTSSETLNAFKDFTLTASKVQEMLTSGTFTNNGFIIIADTESDDCYQFADSENGTPANGPKLVIDYTPPPAGGVFLLNFM